MFRSDFPIFTKKKELIYFDSAVSAQKPRIVIDAVKQFYEEEYATVHRAIYSLAREAGEKYQSARKKVKEFLNAESEEEIIFTRGTTASLNLVARSFCKAFLKKGDTILVTEIEHHANLIPWQMIAEEMDLQLKFLRVNDRGELLLDEAEKMIVDGVKIISLPHISNVIGVRHPIEAIVAMAKKVGARVCLDGAQSAGHIPLDVRKLGVDFFAFSGHKTYGPTGVGVLYGKKEILEKMPPIEGGGDMIENVTLQKTTFSKAPLKFEAGTPMTASVLGLCEALNYISGIGLEKIESHEKNLVEYARKRLLEIPQIILIGDAKERGAILSFVVKGVHTLDLGSLLDCKGIAMRTGHHCSMPAMDRFGVKTTARISFGLYNSIEEIDFFIESLLSILKKF